jgi:hypothetical protein
VEAGPVCWCAETQQALGAWKQKSSEWTLTALSHRAAMKERQSSGGLGHRLLHWASSTSVDASPTPLDPPANSATDASEQPAGCDPALSGRVASPRQAAVALETAVRLVRLDR